VYSLFLLRISETVVFPIPNLIPSSFCVADVDDNVVDDFRSKIGKIVEGYKAEDIFNADETGLFFTNSIAFS
jgi:hypothetical protein